MKETRAELLESPWETAGPADDARDGTLRRVVVGGSAVCLARVDGDWLALGVGRSIWLVRPGYHAGLRGVHSVPAHGRLMDWAP